MQIVKQSTDQEFRRRIAILNHSGRWHVYLDHILDLGMSDRRHYCNGERTMKEVASTISSESDDDGGAWVVIGLISCGATLAFGLARDAHWVSLVALSLLVLVVTRVGERLSFGNHGVGALLAALLFAVGFAVWSHSLYDAVTHVQC